jgi:hypothetical protein
MDPVDPDSDPDPQHGFQQYVVTDLKEYPTLLLTLECLICYIAAEQDTQAPVIKKT